MKTKPALLGLLLIAALMLVACGAAGAEPEMPATAAGEPMAKGDEAAQDSSMAKTGEAAMAEDSTMAKVDDTAMAEDSTMAKAGDTAMAEDSAMAKAGDTAMAEDSAMAKAGEGTEGESHGAVGDTAMAGDEAMAEGAALPAWLMAELVDVNTGQPFAIADQQGKVVLVETLAVWCSNCLRQQKEIQALHTALGERADLVSVGLDIDLNESPEQLRAHAKRHGFDWTYAVATPEVAREIGQLYGNLFLNPPSTPMLVVDRQGQVHPLPFGIKSAGELQEALAPFLGGS